MKQIGGWVGKSSNYLLDKSIDPGSQTQSPEGQPDFGDVVKIWILGYPFYMEPNPICVINK
jgi:hypothetical protein